MIYDGIMQIHRHREGERKRESAYVQNSIVEIEPVASFVLELAVALEHMPLAITQAVAYIKQMGRRCSVRQYLEKLRTSDKSKVGVDGHPQDTLTDLNQDPAVGTAALIEAIRSFPSIVPLLADKLEITLSNSIRSHPDFKIETDGRQVLIHWFAAACAAT